MLRAYSDITLLFFILFLTTCLSGQTTLSGIVLYENELPVIGANAFIADTYDGTSTDLDGRFQFTTEETDSAVLIISYLGYESQYLEIELNGEPLSFKISLTPELSQLDMVVITAGAFEASDEKKAVTLKPLDIVTTAGATADIAGVLNTLPGTQTVGEEGQLFVRGGAAYETRTYIDGMYVQNPYNSSVPTVPARGRFSPFLFKGTTFSTGGYSAEYGQALSSALILNTEDLAPQTVTGISLMSVGLGLSHTQRWENGSIALSGDYTNLAPYVGLVPQNINWEKAPRGAGGQLVYRQKTSETGMLKLQAFANRNHFAMQYPDLEDVTKSNRLDLSNDNLYINTSFREVLGEKWSFFGGLAYSYNLDDIEENFKLHSTEQSFQSRFRLGYHPNEKLNLKFGAEYLNNQVKEKFIEGTQEEVEIELPDQYGAIFAEADYYLSQNLVARIGLRGEYSKLLDNLQVAPRFSLAYKTGEDSQVSFAWGQFYQNPVKEILRFQPNLDFEKASHWILNYQKVWDNRTFRIEGYYKTYDQLARYPTAQPWEVSNSGNGYARGIDLFYRDQSTIKQGDFWISYSFLDTERQFLDYPEPSRPYFASRHNLSLVYKHWLTKLNTNIGFTYSLASPRSYDDPNQPGFNTGRTPTYQDLSFNASYLTNLFGQFSILYVSVSNIPGFENSFGYRFSALPNEDGQYQSLPIEPPAKRFLFVGLFISIGRSAIQTE